jgi:hypothetical protein
MGAKVSDKSCDFVGASHHQQVSFRSVDAYLISCLICVSIGTSGFI